MATHFEVFGLTPSPWVDQEALKSRFHQLASECHPDRFHQAPQHEQVQAHERHTSLNAAYKTLSHTKSRLGYLLSLEFGESPQVVEQVPGPLMDRFMEVAQLIRGADKLNEKLAAATSPMVKAQLAGEAILLSDQLTTYRSGLEQELQSVESELPALAQSWTEAPDWAKLRDIYRTVSHLSRWSNQLAERMQSLIF